MICNKSMLLDRPSILTDSYLDSVKNDWFSNSNQKTVTNSKLIPQLNEWFQSTKFNNLQGWQHMPCIDLTMGCAHYIESFIIRHGWDGFQILNNEYAYYSFMGKWGVSEGQLEPNKPLIITLPHFKWAGIRPTWPAILRECETKNIDIHIDMAWVTLARNVNIDFSHPCIQSVGMSISKYSMQWNRVGLRYSKQRSMDSITMFNHFYQPQTNENLSSCCAYVIERIPRDYGWKKYQTAHESICRELDLESTDLVHVVKDKMSEKTFGISDMLRLV